MKEFTIAKEEAGQRLHKYLARLLPNAGTGFTYKMLRKKNITLNHSRAEGSEMLSPGDVVTVFFSDETFAKMSGAGAASVVRYSERPLTEEQIVYEDEHLMAVFKPAGVLSQKDDSGLESLNEQALQYLMDRGDLTEETVRKFKPGICNRLDRNTAGIVWFAKTLAGAQGMAEVLRNRNVEKYYFAFVAGILTKSADVTLYLTKDEATNTVTVSKDARDGALVIHTGVWPVTSSKRATLVRIRLYTGKSHQIR
ncbi:MAG: RluA family pseudouridine synthase, partial [Lachnospiraceae bacterium]|nr:RluA family pseudouridine synthase [Lachnospiraceae bacterium]